MIALGLLIVIYRGNAANYYLTTAEFRAGIKSLSGKRVRVAGQVINKSVKSYDQAAGVLRFEIGDGQGKSAIAVAYRGLPPENFDPDGKVIVEGVATATGLEADNILWRCPENYLPEQAISGLSKTFKIEGLLYR